MGPDCSVYTTAAQYNGCVGGYVLICGILPLILIIISLSNFVGGEKQTKEHRPPKLTDMPYKLTTADLAREAAAYADLADWEKMQIPEDDPRYEPEPDEPEFCRFCGIRFDASETICKHCGGPRR